jgi:Tol biopolymer transport system component/DNA-binding winged helix-turn-helix (wHTH) protein
MSQQPKHFYEFGPFRLDAGERVLLRDGQIVPLQPKVFETLRALVERHGHVMDKDELLRRVWPDTFVEEVSLAKNVFVLRKTLGDDREYIETIPKRGYRFVAEVREGRAAAGEPAASAEELLAERVGTESSTTPPPSASRPKQASRRAWSAALLTLGLLVSAAVWWVVFRRSPELPPPQIAPFTTFAGSESHPSFSPDGNQIAFTWTGEQGNNLDIYVKQIGNESPVRLTTHPARDGPPCWSPDGRFIAFTRRAAEENGLYVIPSLGGTERKIAVLPPTQIAEISFPLSWSSDSEWLAVMDQTSPQEPFAIFLVARETGEKRQLTVPPVAASDLYPAISPDGKTVAFFRRSGGNVGDLYVMPMAGGEARRLTFDQAMFAPSPAWTPDGAAILFLSARGGSAFNLWKVPAAGGAPVRVEAVGRNISDFAITRQGQRLAWGQGVFDANIWRLELVGAGKPKPAPQRLIASTRFDMDAQFSPDGGKIAFASDRSGSWEIWVCQSDGQHPVQLTSFNRSLSGSPRWSPDGRQIAFDSRAEGNAEIFVISAEGGKPRRLTTEPSPDVVPSWSRDGQWIYFSSSRSGSPQVWKQPASGGQAVQVTSRGGLDPVESPDGQFLYYTKERGAPGIWRAPTAGGEETLVLDHRGAGRWRYWVVVEQGIYFATAEQPDQPLLEFFSFAGGRVTPVATLEKKIGVVSTSGLALSPDGRQLIWQQLDQVSSDIMLMENFR